MSQLSNFDWENQCLEACDIEYLESARIPLEEGFELLTERDNLFRRIGQWVGSDLQRFIAIHRIVELSQQQSKNEYPAPYEIIKRAAEYWAEGVIDGKSDTRSVSLQMISYQIWRGKEFREAFSKATPTNPSAKRLVADINSFDWFIEFARAIEEVLEND